MYRHRNRPKYSDEELTELYKTPHDHTRWPDHIARVEKTIEVGVRLVNGDLDSWEYSCGRRIADLSCGDGAIVEGVSRDSNVCQGTCFEQHLGDFAPGYQYYGPIEETVHQLPQIDLFVCSETIEHLDNPDSVLECIRAVSSKLLLSTPNCSWPDPNPEHYWSWDKQAVESMLTKAGWRPKIYEESYTGLGYHYQIWGCV